MEAIDPAEESVYGPPFTGAMVFNALAHARDYIKTRTGKQCCLNSAGEIGVCDCIFDLHSAFGAKGTTLEEKLDYHMACEEMASWFQNVRDRENLDKEFHDMFENCVWVCPQNCGRAHTKMVDLIWGLQPKPKIRLNEEDSEKCGDWYKYDWKVEKEAQVILFHSTMCVPTTLLVWQILVGKDYWESKLNPPVEMWLSKDYKKILAKAAMNAELTKKQKVRQRLFYARIEDFLAGGRSAKKIRQDNCLEAFVNNGWKVNEENEEGEVQALSRITMKDRMRHQWDNWHFKDIRILVGGSDFLFNKGTKALVDRFNIRVARIDTKTMDFLEHLFSLFFKYNKGKFSKVARDKKLLFLNFRNSTSLQQALDVFFSVTEKGSLRRRLKVFMDKNETKKMLAEADATLLDRFKTLVGDNCTEVAYQPSLLASEVHKPQGAHVDYDTAKGNQRKYMVAFLPLTRTGQFVQLWEPATKTMESKARGRNVSVFKPKVRGEIVFIPRGQLVLVPGDTIHGGGFRAEHRTDKRPGHLRLHFYVYPGENECMVDMHKNTYLDKEYDKNPTYLDNAHLASKPEKTKKKTLQRPSNTLQKPANTLQNTFFNGKM